MTDRATRKPTETERLDWVEKLVFIRMLGDFIFGTDMRDAAPIHRNLVDKDVGASEHRRASFAPAGRDLPIMDIEYCVSETNQTGRPAQAQPAAPSHAFGRGDKRHTADVYILVITTLSHLSQM